MCDIKDLVVMVVEPDPVALNKICGELHTLGVTRIVCVDKHKDALNALTENSTQIDIILADFDAEEGKDYRSLLCKYLKENLPGVAFILTSKHYSCSIVIESWEFGSDDIFDKTKNGEITHHLKKWLVLSQKINEAREELYGKKTIRQERKEGGIAEASCGCR